MIYIAVILTSTLLNYLSEKSKNKYFKHVFFIISLLMTAVFAGVRSYDTGTDIKTYVLYHFDIAKQSSLASYVQAKGTDSILYSIMIVVVSKLFPNAHWMLFFIQLYINIFFYIAAYRYGKYSYKSSTVFLFVYYCTFYIYVFNIMRQGMAVAMVVLGSVELLYNEKYKYYIVLNIFAILMHPTAIICLAIPILTRILNGKKDLSRKTFIFCMIILSCTVLLVFRFQNIIRSLITVGIVQERYLYSITTYLKDQANFEMYKLVFCMLMIILVCGMRKIKYKVIKELLIIFFMVSFSAYLVGGVSTFTERIGLYYWMIALCISSGYVVNDTWKIKYENYNFSIVIYAILMIVMCIYQFFVCNQAAAYPYVFM